MSPALGEFVLARVPQLSARLDPARTGQRMTRASVIIPVHNNERTLGACLRALAEGSFSRDQHEIIVVDDGSTDTSLAIARGFGARTIVQAHRGAPAARNAGARAASGP